MRRPSGRGGAVSGARLSSRRQWLSPRQVARVGHAHGSRSRFASVVIGVPKTVTATKTVHVRVKGKA